MKEQVLHAQQSREAHVKHMFRCAEPLPKQPKVPAWRTHPAAVPPTLPGTTNVSLYSATLEAIIKGVSQRIAALAGTASSEIGSLESSGKASPSSPCSGRYGCSMVVPGNPVAKFHSGNVIYGLVSWVGLISCLSLH